ncbi:MAG: ATP-binding cassette domain-containing protein [Rhizobiaceae bacterium]
MNVATAMKADDKILTVEHLTMRFGGLVAINDLSFEAKRGEITALIGPNGAGKTTVFNCITGFYKPTEGMITIQGQDGSTHLLERMPDYVITAKAKVARTFQNIRLFSGMTVLENLLVAQHNKLMKASGFTVLGLLGLGEYKGASARSIELAKHWLDRADLTKRADDPAGDLPYGAQRRLEIARAMCTEPELLCLDEPAAGLNPRESAALNKLLLDIKHETGTSILLIEHDMSVVMEISDHVVVLEYGQKISDGDPTSVKSDPKVIAAYLGVDDEAEIDIPAVRADLAAVIPASKRSSASGSTRGKSSKAAKPAAKTVTRRASATTAKSAKAPASKAPTAKAPAAKAPAAKAAKAPASKAPALIPGATSNALAKPKGGKADNLTLIKGIGKVNEKKLNDHGIYHFDQIAAWKKADVTAAEAYLEFDGRIGREDWIAQAKKLAKGGQTEFSKRAAAGKVASSRASGAKGTRSNAKGKKS